MSASADDQSGRLLIEWLSPVKVLQKREEDRLVLRFSRPLSADVRPVLDQLGAYLNVTDTVVEGADLTLVLKPDIAAELEIRKRKVVTIDFSRAVLAEPARPSASGAGPTERSTPGPTPTLAAGGGAGQARPPEAPSLPDATLANVKLPYVKLNVSPLDNGVRLTLDWPRVLDFDAKQQDRRLHVTMKPMSRIKQADLSYLDQTLQPWFSRVDHTHGADGTSLIFHLRPMVAPLVRREGDKRVTIEFERNAAELARSEETVPVPAFKPKLQTHASEPSAERPPALPQKRPVVIQASHPKSPAAGGEKAVGDGKGDALIFDWTRPVGAAVFKRAGYLWVVFDAPPDLSKQPLPPPAPAFLMAGELIPVEPEATAMRFALKEDIGFQMNEDDGGRWRLEPAPDAVPPTLLPLAPAGPSGLLHAAALSNGQVIELIDPLVGDQLSVWPIRQAGKGQATRRRFVDLEVIPSLQGLIWRSFNDRLVAKPVADGLEFSSEQGLRLSGSSGDSAEDDANPSGRDRGGAEPLDEEELSEAQLASAPDGDGEVQIDAPDQAPPDSSAAGEFEAKPASYLDLAGAGLDRKLVAETRRILRQAIGKASPEDRDLARLKLAKLLVAEAFASEAKIVLRNISANLETSIGLSKRALEGASAFLTGDVDQASAFLRATEFDGDDEMAIWRAALDSLNKDWPLAAEGWKEAGRNLDAYPSKLRLELGLLALEAAIETADDTMIRRGFRRVKSLELKPHEQARVDRLHALQAVRAGDLERAEEILKGLVEGRHVGLSLLADFELASLALNQGSNDPGLIAALHERLPLWRGHPREVYMIDSLARRYRDAKEPREALDLWAYLQRRHPETAADPVINDMRESTYIEAVNDLAGQEISLLEAYSIYLDFISLLPDEPDARNVQRNLARHLAGLDLLDEAALVLQPLFDNAVDQADKAEIGAELATLLLFQDRPGDVLAVLDQSGPLGRERAAAIDTERMILGAHALARLDRDDEALERIKSLQNAAAHHVRAEIFWKQQNWDRLSLAIEAFLRDPVLPSPLPEEDQKLVLWLALAQGQLRQTEELGELRRRFGADMASGPWGDAFAVATQTAGRRRDIPAVLADTESQIAEMQKFRESVRATP